MQRPPADLARQRRDHPKAAERDRPPELLLRARKLQHPPRRPRTGRARHRRLRGRAREGRAASSTPPSSREIVFVRGATEGINLVAQSWGRQNIQQGRRDRHHLAGAPRQHRPLADALRREGRAAPRRSRRRHGANHARRVREAARPAARAGLVHPGLQRARHRHSRAAR